MEKLNAFERIRVEHRQKQYLERNFTKQQLFKFCLEKKIDVSDCHTKKDILEKHAEVVFDAIAKVLDEHIKESKKIGIVAKNNHTYHVDKQTFQIVSDRIYCKNTMNFFANKGSRKTCPFCGQRYR